MPYDAKKWEFARTRGDVTVSMDVRHVEFIYELLMTGKFKRVLEIGCFNGFSTSALVQAVQDGCTAEVHCCDVSFRDCFKEVVSHSPKEFVLHAKPSVEVLSRDFDLVIVDGDHGAATVSRETGLILAMEIGSVVAHDVTPSDNNLVYCAGSKFLGDALRTNPCYATLQDSKSRPAERTDRGLMFAARNEDVFRSASDAWRKTVDKPIYSGKETRAVASLAYGPVSEAMYETGRKLRERYAEKCGAEVFTVRHVKEVRGIKPYVCAMLAKLDSMRLALARYDRVFWMDADTIIRPDTPDIFSLVPRTHFAAFDECSLAMQLHGWQGHVKTVHDHMVEVCKEDGLPVPDTKGRSFNCGVHVASKEHAFLYEPAKNPKNHDWAEQSRINVRLFLAGTPVWSFPDTFNHMAFFWRKNVAQTAWVIHYAGQANQDERLPTMRQHLAEWKASGFLEE